MVNQDKMIVSFIIILIILAVIIMFDLGSKKLSTRKPNSNPPFLCFLHLHEPPLGSKIGHFNIKLILKKRRKRPYLLYWISWSKINHHSLYKGVHGFLLIALNV